MSILDVLVFENNILAVWYMGNIINWYAIMIFRASPVTMTNSYYKSTDCKSFPL